MTDQVLVSTTGRLFCARHPSVPDIVANLHDTPNIVCVALRVNGWFSATLESSIPLMNEPADSAPIYQYRYLVRRGRTGHFLVVTSHYDLLLSLLQRAGFHKLLTNPAVNIPMVVKELTDNPGSYAMSAVFAYVDGYGESIRSISFYGDDLAEAALFRETLPKIRPRRVSLRDVTTMTEVLSIGSRGQISFHYSGDRSLVDVDSALRFLSQRNYLTWEAEADGRELV